MTVPRADGAATARSSARPVAAPTSEPTEAEMADTILETARVTGWRIAHFRPALTKWGWRTAVQGDGAGFPDLVMIHPRARLVWWAELKMLRGRLTPEQELWRDALEAAGASYLLVRGKAGLDRLVDEMAEHATAAR